MATKIGEIWSDLDHRFVEDGQGQLRKVTNVQSVLTSIDNILKTYPGERVMIPQFGSPLQGIIFDNMNQDTLQFLSDQIQQVIEVWDDRVEVTEVGFYTDPDRNTVSLDLQFKIRGHEQVFQYRRPVEENGSNR